MIADVIARWGSMFLSVFRLVVGLSLVMSHRSNDVALVFGLSEVVMSSFAMVNARWAVIQSDVRGWMVVACYMLGYLVVPVSGPSPVGLEVAMLFLAAARLWCLVDLGVCYSVGPPSFVGEVASTGPYSFVRHPMQSLGLVMRVVFVVVNPALVNVLGLTAMSLAAVVVCLGEERFLASQSVAYRAYCARVRWRLLPGVW